MSELPWENKKGNVNSSNEHSSESGLPWESERKKDISIDEKAEDVPDIFVNAVTPSGERNGPDVTVHPAFLPKMTSNPTDEDDNITAITSFENDDVHIDTIEQNVSNIAVVDEIKPTEENHERVDISNRISTTENEAKKAPLPLFEPDIPGNDTAPFNPSEHIGIEKHSHMSEKTNPSNNITHNNSSFGDRSTQGPSNPMPDKKGKGFLFSITNTLKRITQKRKLIDRMEELKPITPENVNGEETHSPFSEEGHRTIDPGNRIEHPITTTENFPLEDIRTVVPVENNTTNPNIKLDEFEMPIDMMESPVLDVSSEEMKEMKNELADSRHSQENIITNIDELAGTIEELKRSLNIIQNESEGTNSSIDVKIDRSTGHINMIEERLSELEDTLQNIHADNSELKTGLSSIEENIAELTSSHTVILSQIQKITEFGNSRSAEIFATNDRIDKMEESLTSLTQIQSESQKSVQELRNVASDLIKGLEKAHNTNKEFKTDTDEQNELLKDQLEELTDYVENELKAIGARSYKGNGANVQLNNIIKNSTNMKLCMEWLEFLMELVGCNHLSDLLSYYEELGWINEDIRIELLRYAEGIDYYIEKSDWKLAPDDHVRSIWFIEQLVGLKVDKNRLSIIDKDIKKVIKGTEIYGI
ncbi:FlaD/FlaE family flagellar protein [Methanococcoides alaskense]|uniref:Archaellum component FlaD/FlaE n=1 Tax=Methanococcoides alaskense TaxID=325778 RepID=A0AA90TXV0_9EURY|nr:FlaD/FlaE family flagellar protein [Methanococcoides alaskense]MDA0525216.1 hypothetical protein [Methanococcoides alaskense]MDR6221861.1 archaellum component FlaD/FlaE [Methanococcoides alaskense]